VWSNKGNKGEFDFWTKALSLSAHCPGPLQEFLDIVLQCWKSE
jgi:hypothetical protein